MYCGRLLIDTTKLEQLATQLNYSSTTPPYEKPAVSTWRTATPFGGWGTRIYHVIMFDYY